MSSPIIAAHQPCPCGKSSDAYSEREDGSGFCFSCATNFAGSSTSPPDIGSLQVYPIRGHTRRAEEFYGFKTEIAPDGTPIRRYYPYPEGWAKVRNIKDKTFFSIGDQKAGLGGRDKFSAGQNRVVTIVEGEEDMLSAFEMLGGKYPVVTVRSSSTAKADCIADRDFLNAFDKIILCFDTDDPGQRAKEEVSRLFDFNKVYECKLTQYKDANAYEEAGKHDEFRSVWYNAKRFLPEGIISSFREFSAAIRGKQATAIASYPFPEIQAMSYGIREGEVVLITAQEGVGKTEFIRAIEHGILKNTDVNLACVHMEENQNRQLRGLAGLEIGLPCHLPDSPVSVDEIDKALGGLIKRDDRLHLYKHFDSDDPDLILDRVRFLVSAAGCKIVTLDHISQLVADQQSDKERQYLDYLSTKFVKMTEDLGFAFLMISHLNDSDQTRGSRYPAKIAATHIQLKRNVSLGENTTEVYIIKNRFGSRTGPAGRLYFDPSSFMLRNADEIEKEVLPPV